MKKLFLGLLLVVAALGLSACGKKEDDVLQKMEAANTNETLLKNNEKVAFRETHYPADGAAESTWLYQDAKRYVFENDYGVFIDEDGDVYGLDKEENVKYRYLFVDNAYEEFKYNWEWLAGYVYSPEEELLFPKKRMACSISPQNFVILRITSYICQTTVTSRIRLIKFFFPMKWMPRLWSFRQ